VPQTQDTKLPTSAGCELEINGFSSIRGRELNRHVTAAKSALALASIDSYETATDGSCGYTGDPGVEVKTKIMKTEGDIVELARAVRALKNAGGETNHFCGMHVHLGYTGKNGGVNFSRDRIARYRFTRFMVRHEDTMFDLCDASRRGNRFCFKFVPEVRAALINGEGFEKAFEKYLSAATRYNNDRHCWVNMQAIEKYGTFENRLWHGSLEEDMVLGWVNTQLQIAKLTLVDGVKFDWNHNLTTPRARIERFIDELCHDNTARCEGVRSWLTTRMLEISSKGAI